MMLWRNQNSSAIKGAAIEIAAHENGVNSLLLFAARHVAAPKYIAPPEDIAAPENIATPKHVRSPENIRSPWLAAASPQRISIHG